MKQVDAYLAARRIAREWIAKNGAPAGIEREAVRVLTGALMANPIEQVVDSTLERIMGEVLEKYVAGQVEGQKAGRA